MLFDIIEIQLYYYTNNLLCIYHLRRLVRVLEVPFERTPAMVVILFLHLFAGL